MKRNVTLTQHPKLEYCLISIQNEAKCKSLDIQSKNTVSSLYRMSSKCEVKCHIYSTSKARILSHFYIEWGDLQSPIYIYIYEVIYKHLTVKGHWLTSSYNNMSFCLSHLLFTITLQANTPQQKITVRPPTHIKWSGIKTLDTQKYTGHSEVHRTFRGTHDAQRYTTVM